MSALGVKLGLAVAALLLPTLAHAEGKTIAFMRAGPDPYYQFGMEAAETAAKDLGVTLTTYNANNDSTQELANIQDAITNKYGSINTNQYLSIIFAGFEVWGGGDGLKVNRFCANVK